MAKWNKTPDLSPLPKFLKHDSRNLTAANARLAELRFREKEKLVTPPEKLPSWERWVDPRSVAVRPVTAEFCGDPSPARSALGGYQQRGIDWERRWHEEWEDRKLRERLYGRS